MKRNKPTHQWRRWHRWFGLVVAIPVLILSVTGVLLNHIESLSWADRPLPPWLARWYGAPVPDGLEGQQVAGHWYSHSGERLFVGDRDAFYCPPPFRGVARDGALLVVGCGPELLLVNADGQQVERLGPAYGVPVFSALGQVGERRLGLQTPEGVVHFDTDQLAALPLSGDNRWHPVRLQVVPARLETRVLARSVPPSLNWQRLLLDLHAGRIAGLAGQLVMDLAALLLSILAITGTVIWARSRR
ncbi:MAG: PepSY domain-containing protein [Pseudomonadales bacterium]|nr:PepSY domain-containing protein [Pseudomonadales bacterium]